MWCKRYNRKGGAETMGGGHGCHVKFFKKLIKNKGYHEYLDRLPKPMCDSEFAILSQFIFGVPLGVKIDLHHDQYKDLRNFSISSWSSKKETRAIKLAKLSNTKTGFRQWVLKEYKRNWHFDDDDFIFASIRYECSVPHHCYSDHQFNISLGTYSSYETETLFFKHTIGKLNCGGIAGTNYGTVDIINIREYARFLHWRQYKDMPPRNCFLKEIERLKKEDRSYDKF